MITANLKMYKISFKVIKYTPETIKRLESEIVSKRNNFSRGENQKRPLSMWSAFAITICNDKYSTQLHT